MKYADSVLSYLASGPISGKELRNRLNADKWFWQRWSRPAFYALMARLEDAGIVESWQIGLRRMYIRRTS